MRNDPDGPMGTRDDRPLPHSGGIKIGYVTARALRGAGRNRISRTHIVRTQTWAPWQNPVADRVALCKVKTADSRHTLHVPVEDADCRACIREHKRLTAG